MNLGQLRTGVRNLLNEDVPGFWTDAQLNSYINMAANRVDSIISSLREDYLTISATFTASAGVSDYALPPDCRYIRRMEIYDPADANNLVKLDEVKFPRLEANGDWLFTQNAQPKRFFLIGKQFRLLPIPDATYNIRLYYDADQPDMATDTDTPATPIDFQDMIVYWACVLAKKQNDMDDGGFVQLFNIRKSELIETIIRRGGEDAVVGEAYLQGII